MERHQREDVERALMLRWRPSMNKWGRARVKRALNCHLMMTKRLNLARSTCT